MARKIDDAGFTSEVRILFTRAREAASRAYAPYSRFRVGAAVQGKHGVYCGANVENASLGLSFCAERAALATAVFHGERGIQALAVACIDGNAAAGIEAFMPCGACRQWFTEFMPDAEIFVLRIDTVERFSVSELLPLSFRLSN